MAALPKDDLFIHKLLEETYQFLPEDETAKSPAELFKYFQNHDNIDRYDSRDSILFSYLNKNGVPFAPLEYLKDSGCFRLNLQKTVYDIPSNWSIFAELKQISGNELIIINEASDKDHLRKVFSQSLSKDVDLLILINQGRLYFSLISAESEEIVCWVSKYLGLKGPAAYLSNDPIKTAA